MQDAQTFPKPGPIGRGARLLLGAALLLVSALTLVSFRGYLRIGAPSGPWWLLAVISFYSLRQVIDIGFGRAWGSRSQVVALLLAVAAVALDLAVYRNLWGPPLGALLYAMGIFVVGYMGLSFVLAGILGVPGCEMRAIPSVLAGLSGGKAEPRH